MGGRHCSSSTVLLSIIITTLLLLSSSSSVIASVVSATARPSHAPSSRKFTLPLIHRDSLLSPLRRRHTTTAYNDAVRRGIHRARSRFGMKLTVDSSGGSSQVFPDQGEYLLKLSVGTPPFDVYGIADTGSDLFWTQCLPCDQCYNQTRPKFDPAASSTYANLDCVSDKCHLLDTVSCSASMMSSRLCNYTYGYASNALTKGFLATDTVTLSTDTNNNTVSIPNIVFGCGHNNTGGFNPNEMGLVGLGRGPLSFISQMAPYLGGRKIFSHCLVPFHTDPNISGKITFGAGSEIPPGPGVASTPLFITDLQHQDPTYYFVTLNGITVGNIFIPFSNATVSKGNMFIDSGTPPTIVPRDLHGRLVTEVKKAVPPEVKPVTERPLCYGEGVLVKGPVLTARFDGSADVELKQRSVFIEAKPGVFCFAFEPTDSDGGIVGNFAQTDYLVGFDIDRRTVSFKPTDCTKYS